MTWTLQSTDSILMSYRKRQFTIYLKNYYNVQIANLLCEFQYIFSNKKGATVQCSVLLDLRRKLKKEKKFAAFGLLTFVRKLKINSKA